MKKTLIASLIVTAIAVLVGIVVAKKSKDDILDDEDLDDDDDYEEFFGNDEGDIDIDVNLNAPEDVQDFSEDTISNNN